MICRVWKRMALVMMPAIAVALGAASGAQAQVLTVTNGEFTQYAGPGTPGYNPSSSSYGTGSDQFNQVMAHRNKSATFDLDSCRLILF